MRALVESAACAYLSAVTVLLLFAPPPEFPPVLLFEMLAPLSGVLSELVEADGAPELPLPLPLSLLAEMVSAPPSDFADPAEPGAVFLRP